MIGYSWYTIYQEYPICFEKLAGIVAGEVTGYTSALFFRTPSNIKIYEYP